MKCLVTGATGFLGRCIAEVFAREFTVLRQGFSHSGADFQVDLRDPEAVRCMLKTHTPDLVINSAAFRDPDFCEEHPEEAQRLNAEAVCRLSECLPAGKRLVQVSTDYVFGNGSPPYCETDETSPINVYGRTKRDGETWALQHPKGLALRIPLLVGAGPSWEESGFIYKTAKMIAEGKPAESDNMGIRFPTWIEDVAEALLFLVKQEASGIFHFSSSSPATKYELCQQLARLMNRSGDHIIPSKDPVSKAVRPANTQLDTSKIRGLGFNRFHTFEEVAAGVLATFPGF